MKKIYAFLFAVAAAAGSAAWALPYARAERGYNSAGGEWILIIMVFIVTYKAGRLLIRRAKGRR